MATANLIEATENYPQVLVSQQLANSETAIYTCPASKSVVIDTATLCNTSGATVAVYLSVVKTGGTAGAANRVAIIPALLPSDSTSVVELTGFLGPGDFISGYASAATSVAIVLRGAVSS
jgi:hypothetical protein